MESIINLLKSKNYSYEDIYETIKIINSDYIIFLSNKFFKVSCFNFKKKLLKYFDKYNITYLKYLSKNIIFDILNTINKNIIMEKNLKKIFFSESIIEPDLLYKKIKFSNQEIFVIFSNYTLKKIEYKLRTFCQIAEKLGVEKIVINYNSKKKIDMEKTFKIEGLSNNVGYQSQIKKLNEEDIQIIFEYPDNHIDINLNKFNIINSIVNENEFLITKEEFESDLEMKFLIDARCVNFMQKYNTNFIMKYVNKIEKKIFLKAKGYGINIGNLNLRDNYIKISISIDFYQIQNNLEIIDGTNIHVLREGFIYLANIVKKDEKYDKLIQFMQSHLNAICKKWIFLNYEYDHIKYINETYNNIINLNFDEREIYALFKKFFENNLTWHRFKKLRDLILKGSDDKIDKLCFVSFQYHDIINNKKYIMSNIFNYLDDILILVIENNNVENIISDLSFCINFEMEEEVIKLNDLNNLSIISFIKENKIAIKDILYNSLKKSFKFNNGLSDNLMDTSKLVIVIKNIINYYYNNDINNLQKEFNKKNTALNIKKIIFDELINLICSEIVKSLNILDTSPHINLPIVTKSTLFSRVQKIFLKFIIKYLNFENNLDKIYCKLGIDKNIDIEPLLLIETLDILIPINNCYNNYIKYKLFYSWNDFNYIINYFNH